MSDEKENEVIEEAAIGVPLDQEAAQSIINKTASGTPIGGDPTLVAAATALKMENPQGVSSIAESAAALVARAQAIVRDTVNLQSPLASLMIATVQFISALSERNTCWLFRRGLGLTINSVRDTAGRDTGAVVLYIIERYPHEFDRSWIRWARVGGLEACKLLQIDPAGLQARLNEVGPEILEGELVTSANIKTLADQITELGFSIRKVDSTDARPSGTYPTAEQRQELLAKAFQVGYEL